ncbi:MAG: hypothetical protein ACKVOW_05185 [Chitinophagaceae bacterium]
MKKTCSFAIVFIIGFAGFSQTDTALNNRLNEYIKVSKSLNIVRLMDYIHPSLFTLAPREEMIKLFENVYDNKDMSIVIDTLQKGLMSKPFFIQETQYVKVDYYMVMQMTFKNEDKMNDSNFVNSMSGALQDALPKKSVSYNSNAHYFTIRGMDVLLAIKDGPSTEWFFLGYDGKNEMTKSLFPKELIEHFELE